MRAAVIVNPVKVDVPALREQVDKTLGAAGWAQSQRSDPDRRSGRPRAAAGGDGRLTE